MREVLIKGYKQYLFTLDEDIPSEVIENDKQLGVKGSIPEPLQDYMTLNPVRPILIHFALRDWLMLSFVFWYAHNSQEYVELDENIQNEEKHEDWFDKTVILDYQKTRCKGKCRKLWHTLIMSRNLVARDPILNEAPRDYLPCPECGGSFRQTVIVVIGEAEEDE